MRCSQAVTHPSTNRTLRCLTSVCGREPVDPAWYGRWRETGRRAPYLYADGGGRLGQSLYHSPGRRGWGTVIPCRSAHDSCRTQVRPPRVSYEAQVQRSSPGPGQLGLGRLHDPTAAYRLILSASPAPQVLGPGSSNSAATRTRSAAHIKHPPANQVRSPAPSRPPELGHQDLSVLSSYRPPRPTDHHTVP